MLNGQVCSCRDCKRARKDGYVLGSRRGRFSQDTSAYSEYVKLPDYRNARPSLDY